MICAFADHSTSLFSIYDSPSSSSIKAKSPSPTVLPPNAPVSRVDGTRQHLLPSRQKAGASYAAQDFEWDSAAPSQHFKRRQSEVSESSNSPIPLNRARISSEAIANDDEPSHQAEGSTSRPTTRYAIQDLANEIVRDARSHGFVPTHSEGNDRVDDVEFGPETLQARLRRMEEWDGDDVLDNTDEDGHYPLVDDWDDEMELDEDDFDDYDDEDGYDEVEDDADLEDLMDEDEDDGLMRYVSPPDIFSNVDFIPPRRCFKGAKNSETVKDCNFLGSRSDKVCSGSDDGNFFVWDKDTGKLEGIWEGDGQIVNVMEQHPTLPMVAVSGIDNTVKLFSPMFKPPDPSFSRLHLQESIIRANTTRPRYQTGSSFGSASLLDFLSSRGVVRFPQHDDDDSDDEDDEGIRGQPQCATQ